MNVTSSISRLLLNNDPWRLARKKDRKTEREIKREKENRKKEKEKKRKREREEEESYISYSSFSSSLFSLLLRYILLAMGCPSVVNTYLCRGRWIAGSLKIR